MIRIVCTKSLLTLLPIRALLHAISFRPKDNKQCAAYTLLFPFVGRYRKALGSLSLIERVPEVQFLGIVSQWRVRRWFAWLARAIVPLIQRDRIFFYHAERMDEPTHLFLEILQPQVPSGTINLMYGPPSYDGAQVADTADLMVAEEREVVTLLNQPATELSTESAEKLFQAGVGCVLSANFWQAEVLYRHLVPLDAGRTHYVLGLAHRFYEQLPAAEWHYLQAVKTGNPVHKIQARYALAGLHMRFHEQDWQSLRVAEQHLDLGDAVQKENDLPYETRIYSQTMLAGGRALLQYRQGKNEEAKATSLASLALLDTLPDDERALCCRVTVLSNLAQLAYEKGDMEEATALNARLIELDPQMPRWWVEYAKCLLAAGETTRAHQVVEEGLSLHFDCAHLHALQGECLKKVGQHQNSAQAFERATRYDPIDQTYYDAHREALARASKQQSAL